MTLLVQLTDLHVSDGDGAPAANAERAVAAAAAYEPDAVLVTGDLVNGPSDSEYERVRELLAPLTVPVHVLPGNHDDPQAMRRHFGAPGGAADPLQYVAEVGGLRLIACDTTTPGPGDGALGPERRAWIEARLAENATTPTLLALHHPPLLTTVPAFDDYRLADEDRAALAGLLRRSPNVVRVLCGHLHRTTVGTCGGVGVFVGPATSMHLELSFRIDDLEALAVTGEPPGLAVHRWADGELTTHVLALDA